jgi:hypothetical protein
MSITDFQVFGQQRSRGKKWPVMTMPPIKGNAIPTIRAA